MIRLLLHLIASMLALLPDAKRVAFIGMCGIYTHIYIYSRNTCNDIHARNVNRCASNALEYTEDFQAFAAFVSSARLHWWKFEMSWRRAHRINASMMFMFVSFTNLYDTSLRIRHGIAAPLPAKCIKIDSASTLGFVGFALWRMSAHVFRSCTPKDAAPLCVCYRT